MKIIELLKELKFGKPQAAGNMIVVPLTSKKENKDVSEDMIFFVSRDDDYSNLTLRNDGDRPVIVPQGTSYITDQKAQDRCVLKGTILNPRQAKTVDVSCIESGQGGHISTGTDDYTFIAAAIRNSALNKSDTGSHSYEVLWEDVSEYKKKLNLDGRAHMTDFYKHFKKDLDEFVAQFETVENQLGAIVFINNEIVGIEVYPNYTAWRKVWRKLLRDSYGADAISMIKKDKAAAYKPYMNIDNVDSIETMEAEAHKVMVKVIEFVKAKTDPFVAEEITCSQPEIIDDMEISKFRGPTSFQGQVMTKSGELIYLTGVKALD